MAIDFIRGASYPLRTVKLFARNPQLLQYLAIPMLVNLVLGVGIYALSLRWAWRTATNGYVWLEGTLSQAIARLPNWLQWLNYGADVLGVIVGVIFIIFVFILVGFILMQFGVILGAPWYGKLSEKLEKLRTNSLEIVEVGFFRDIARAILFELKKLALILCISPLLFAINFLPAIGTVISSVGGITLTSTIVCLDFFDSPLERRRFTFRQKLKLVYGAFPASGGFGLICLALISLPLLNLLTIPICVASGTLFVCDRILPRLKPAQTLE